MFRKRREVKPLSAEELQTKLYSHFEKTGSLNRMRTELRGQLVSELLKVAVPLETTVADEAAVDFNKHLLPLQVGNWLVYDHLLRKGHQYTLSVFMSEANLAQPEKQLTACDILHLFQLDSTTSEYKSIIQMYSSKDAPGSSNSLLLAIIKCLLEFSHQAEQQMTTGVGGSEFRDTRPKELLHKLTPELIPLSEKEQNISSKQHSSRKDIFCERSKLTESSFSEQLQLVKEEKEREIFSMRQRLLKELDRLHEHERLQSLEIEHERHQLKKEHDALLAQKEKIKEKELLLTKEYHNKLERKVRELETNFTSKEHFKEKSLEDLQHKLSVKEKRLAQMQVDFSSQEASFDFLKKELEDIRIMHKIVQEKYFELLDDNTKLLKKFEGMSDYAVLKDELESKSRQVSSLQLEIEDITKTSEKEKGALTEIKRNLETKLTTKDSEVLETQGQLNLLRDTLHMKETVWGKEKRKLEQENFTLKDMFKIFSQKIEEQKDSIQAMHQTIHLLHYQLSEKDNRNSSTSEQLMHHRTPFSEVTKNEPAVFRINRKFKEYPPKYKDHNLKFLEDAKNTMFKLQQQEGELQDKCSVIYSSIPEFNGRFSTNPFIYNSTNAQCKSIVNDPVKRFSNNLNGHLKNLFGNEMPTLDLSAPANNKNPVAGGTFTDIYVPQIPNSSGMATNVVSSSNTPTSEIFSYNRNKIITTTDVSKCDINLKETETVKDKQKINASETENLVPQLSNLKDPLVSHYTIFTTTEGAISKNLTTDNSNKTAQTQVKMLEKLTPNISSLGKASAGNDACFSPVQNETCESNLQVEKKKPSDPDVSQQASWVLISNVADDLAPRDASTLISGDSGSKPTKDFVVKESAIEAPLIIDLDAAWKRKSSLLPHKSLSQSSEHQSIPNNPCGDSLGTSSKSNSKEQIYFAENRNGSQTQNVSNDSNIEVRNEGSDQSSLKTQSSKQPPFDVESKNSNLQEVQEPVTGKQDSLRSEFIKEDSFKSVEVELMKDAVNEVKPVHEDSLSEISEIHLSCGSEQEQQKDDSDNW